METEKGMSKLICDMTDRLENKHEFLMTTISEKDGTFVLYFTTLYIKIRIVLIIEDGKFYMVLQNDLIFNFRDIREVENAIEKLIVNKDKVERLKCVVGEKEMNTQEFLFPIFSRFFGRRDIKKIKEELKKDYTEKEIVKESLRIMESRVKVGEGSGNEFYPAAWFCFLNHSYTFRYETCQKEKSKQEAKKWLCSQGYKEIKPI